MWLWLKRLLLLVAFAAFMFAQYSAIYDDEAREQLWGILAAYLIGGIALGGLFWREPGEPIIEQFSPREREVGGASSSENTSPRIIWLLLCAVLIGMSWGALAGNRFTLLNVGLWLGSVLTFCLAFWQFGSASLGRDTHWRAWGRRLLSKLTSREALALYLVLMLGFMARFYRLESVPPEMNSDHVEKLLDVYDVLTEKYYIFFQRNTGREPMQFYLVAAIIQLFDTGLTFYSLKLSNLLMGVLSVFGTYLLGREIGGRRVAWVAAFFAAVVLWAVAPSRVGLRYPFAPAFTSLSLWALWRALRTQQRNDWLVAGIMLGLGLHGYTSFRIMPLAAIVTVALKFTLDGALTWSKVRDYAQHFTLYVAASVMVFWPLIRYMVQYPDMFWYRSLTRSTSLEEAITEPLWSLAFQTFSRTLGIFNWLGDEVFVSSIPYDPVLNPITSAFFVIGLAYTLFVLTRQKPFVGLALLFNGFLLLTPSALNFAFPRESPSVVRTGGAVPVVAVWFALGVRYLYLRWQGDLASRWQRGVSMALVGTLLIGILIINYQRYFGPYLRTYQQRSMNTAEVANTMRDYLSVVGDTDHMLIKGWPHWLDTRSLGIQLNDVEWGFTHASLELEPLLELDPQDGQPLLYILHPNDHTSLAILQERYPLGYIAFFRSATPKRDYIFFVIPPSEPVVEFDN